MNVLSFHFFAIGFALVLLVIHYLQAECSPAVLPALQKDFPELFRSPKTTVVTELTDDLPPQIQSYKSNNTQSLGELLIGFFKYYSAFKWDRTISVPMGGTQPTRRGRIWSGPYIRLADPTDEGNVTRAVYSLNEFTRIKNAFKSASDRLSQTASLHDILKWNWNSEATVYDGVETFLAFVTLVCNYIFIYVL